VHGSQPAGGLGQGSGVGPALHPAGPAPYPWPPYDYLQLGDLPTAVACARLHARNLLWEWGSDWLAPDAELLVAELVTNAVKATAAREEEAVRLRVSSDGTRVLIEVWDADPRPPAATDRGQDGRPDPQGESGRGLLLVAALSARWDWYRTHEPAGKVVWCEMQGLLPGRLGGPPGNASAGSISGRPRTAASAWATGCARRRGTRATPPRDRAPSSASTCPPPRVPSKERSNTP